MTKKSALEGAPIPTGKRRVRVEFAHHRGGRVHHRDGPPMRRLVGPALAAAAVWAMVPTGIAHAAPVFDVDAYTTCTATTAPAPDQDFDAVVTDCCVRNAGVPAPTKFGMGCVAPVDAAASADERPTIVLPMRPASPDDPDRDLQALIDMPLPDPPP